MMTTPKAGLCLFFALLVGLVWISCGSGPTAPSESIAEGNRLSGRFTNLGSAGSAFQGFAQNALQGITVYVKEDPAIQTHVSSDGSFVLRGLPNGQFTLVFGDTYGELLFDRVLPNTELTIVVQLTAGKIDLVEEKRTGIGHGDLEIEGLAQQVSPGAHPNEGTLIVHSYDIEARPGSTTIREGNRAREMADIRRGNRVHVKGVWEGGTILAHEIKLQGPGDVDNGAPNGTECPNLNGGKVGEKIVLEGTVLGTTDGTGFNMRAEGRVDDIYIDFKGKPRCVGQAGKSGECKVGEGDKVNVKGILDSCTNVQADEVKIQKKG